MVATGISGFLPLGLMLLTKNARWLLLYFAYILLWFMVGFFVFEKDK
jgi:uncharacterized membrane protein SirB2